MTEPRASDPFSLQAPPPVVVVAAALTRGATLLLAQRTRPPELAGQWELPGGKVEPGESDAQALERELREELGVDTVAGEQLFGEIALPGGSVLRAYRASLILGTPAPLDHSELRWVDAEALRTIDLVDADRVWLPELLELLTSAERF